MEVNPAQVQARQFAQGAGDAAGMMRDAAAKIDELETEVSAARDEAEAALLLAQNAVPLHGPQCICTQEAIDEAERVFDRLEDAVSDLINLSSQLESEADDLESIEF